MARRPIALLLAAFVVGCSLEISGTADIAFLDEDAGTDSDLSDTSVAIEDTEPDAVVEDTAATDSAVDTSTGDTGSKDTATSDVPDAKLDTFVPDTGTPDTGPFDTGPFDTGTPDTGSPDTGPFDTGPFDTGPFDTGSPDTGPTAGALSGAGAQFATTTLSLSTEGTLDWAHWGRDAVGAWNHKSGANLITQGTNGSPSRWGDFPITFSWTNGTPTVTESGTNDGIYHATIGNSFNLEVLAHHSQERTLRIYTTWNSSSGTISATLSDASAAAWAGTIPPAGGSGAWIQVAVHTIKFRAGSPNQKLAIKIVTTGGTLGIALLAATLQ